MPNAKVLEEKKALVASLVEKIKNSPAGVLVDYKGIKDVYKRQRLTLRGIRALYWKYVYTPVYCPVRAP